MRVIKGPGIVKVLIVVEDPGAANMVKDLPQALLANNIRSDLHALNAAYTYLMTRQHFCNAWSQEEGFAQDLLTRYKPDLVVVGSSDNPKSPVFELIFCAKRAKIPTLGVVDMRMNADRRFSAGTGDPLDFMPDRLVVTDEATRQDFIKLGMAASCVVALGNPQFDYILKNAQDCLTEKSKSQLKEELFAESADKSVIVFIAEPSSSLNPQLTTKNKHYTLKGTSDSQHRCQIVMEEFLRAVENSSTFSDNKPYLVLRLHPRNKIEDFPRQLIEKFDTVSQHQVPIKLLCAADLVVGLTSMMLLEAAICDTPTLSIVPIKQEGDWLPTVAAGATRLVSTRAELEQFFSNPLPQKSKQQWFQPGALERIAQYIKQY